MEYGNGKTNQLVWKHMENRYHNASFDVDENNLNVNVAMLSKYVQPGEMVLDIGCGEGKLGSILQKKGCVLYGIDLDLEACKFAKQQNGYTQAFQLNIEQENQLLNDKTLTNLREQFDIIAMIDVLEHMVNPTQALLNVLPFAKDGAKILVSVPNMNNADIVLNLLNDQFNYQEAGILDNTHTKFFTRSSFFQWITEINEIFNFSLDCLYVGSTFGYTEFIESISKEYPNIYNIMQQNPYFHVIQHLYVLTVYKDKDDSRLINLNKHLKEAPFNMLNILEKSMTLNKNIVKILPNERLLLEEQIKSANLGWENCSLELNHAGKKIIELQNALKDAGCFQQEQSKKIDVLNDELDVANKKILELEQTLKEAEQFEQKQETDKIALVKEYKKVFDTDRRKISELEMALDEAKEFQQKQETDRMALVEENIKVFNEKEIIIKKEAALFKEFLELQAYATRLENDIDELKNYTEKLETDIKILKEYNLTDRSQDKLE